MYKSFLDTTSLASVYKGYVTAFGTSAPDESVPLASSLGRVLAGDVSAGEDLPGFARSSVDGFALRASDSFGASPSNPIFLPLSQSVVMGVPPEKSHVPGTVAEVPTGGALPEGSDAVVMIEYTDRLGDEIEIRRPVAPGENVIGPKDDIAADSTVALDGEVVTPPLVGVLAALGRERVRVRGRLKVAVLATGDEVVPWNEPRPSPCSIRNVNSPLIAALVERTGQVCEDFGIVPDDRGALEDRLSRAVEESHMVLLSGGSSAGSRDYVREVIESMPGGRVLHHGLALAPGKPTILARIGDKPVMGLPGHPVSCAVVVDRVVLPTLRRMGGERCWLRGPLFMVRLKENLPSRPGREEYARVRLVGSTIPGEFSLPAALPVRGPSGAVATLIRSDGFVRIPMESEGLAAGTCACYFALGGGTPLESLEGSLWDEEST